MTKFKSVLASALRLGLLLAVMVALVSPTLITPAAKAADPQAAAAAPQTVALAAPTVITSTTLYLNVVSARTVTVAQADQPAGTGPSGAFAINAGDPIGVSYKWIINEDKVGNPFQARFPDCSALNEDPANPGKPKAGDPNLIYPQNCQWPSMQPQQAYAPIVAQGTNADLNTITGVSGLPDGQYLISVLALDDPGGHAFKLDGAHFLVKNGVIYLSDATPQALQAAGIDIYANEFAAPSGVVTVEMQPLPIPAATMRAKIFNDDTMVNGQFDSPSEDGNGLAGFRATFADTAGEATVDLYGNPLCTVYYTDTLDLSVDDIAAVNAANPGGADYVPGTTGKILYDAEGAPIIKTVGTGCYSDANGDLVVPNVGPNRWALNVASPIADCNTCPQWIQTTTLEGNHDWDTWVMEASTGYDTEFVNAAEPFPWSIFGFVRQTGKNAVIAGQTISIPTTGNANYTGEIKGVVVRAEVYVPMSGGLPYLGNLWGGLNGAKPVQPLPNPWIALSDLQNGDHSVYVAQGDANGNFSIKGVADGDYVLTYWDEPQMNLLDFRNVSVVNGQVVDLGNMYVAGWFTRIEGHVFLDENENGRMDPGEAGVANLPLAVKRRDNSVIDRGAVGAVTTAGGHFFLENTYPIGFWMIVELYADWFRNTGYTFQAGNQPAETVVAEGAVDISFLPIIGQSGRLDIGIKPYADGENGGIAGSVSYDTTRAQTNAIESTVEGWQPGIPGLTVQLWEPVACGVGDTCDTTGRWVLNADGSFKKGTLLNETLTEEWTRPTGCVSRDALGNPVSHQWVLPSGPNAACLEGPISGVQFGIGQTPLNGNFGFADGCFAATGGFNSATGLCADSSLPTTLPDGDYLVEVLSPNNPVGGGAMYTPTREEDINMYGGDSYSPAVPFPVCAGPLHTVDLADFGTTDGYAEIIMAGGAITVPASTPVVNPSFAANGGSPYEGMPMPLCNVKLVTVSNMRSVAPLFTFFTDVPVPGRWYGYIVDDLNLSTDPSTLFYGEKAGVSHSPIGLYDFTNKLKYTIYSDPNGVYEPLMPSTDTINCPTPSGVCAGMYRHVGNDPGQPGHINPFYDPQFRTISANFENYPGSIIISDLAPTQIGVSIKAPGSQTHASVACSVEPTTPQLFSVGPRPYVYNSVDPLTRQFIITGSGFGATRGIVRLGNINMAGAAISGWTENQITVTVPALMPPGPYQLYIETAAHRVATNLVTMHVLGGNYQPALYEVNATSAPVLLPASVGYNGGYIKIQDALTAATASARALVVVYPGPIGLFNPLGVYYENLIINSPVKLQGVGPGGTYTDTLNIKHDVLGSVVSGLGFGGDTGLAGEWRALVASLDWDGNQIVYEGAVMYVLAKQNQFTNAYRASIDGFAIEGGDQLGFPNNINQIGGAQNGLPPVVETQGGGIFVNGWGRFMQITNNILRSNGGAYGGAIRLGTPNAQPMPAGDRKAWDGNNRNNNILISHNQILANGGTNLAGGIGVFEDSNNFEISYNHICGNFSAEYGGGITVYGYSPNGQIHRNRIYFNRSFDEGGGIMLAGELAPANVNPATYLSRGTGPINVFNNIIQANLSNDDGGGLRFLMAGNYVFNVYNNIFANNISTHEGGGVSLNDAPNVRFYNNTVVKNLTTATAATSTGNPAPAGLSTQRNSAMLQATLPAGSPLYSNPLLFNNIFWDNRAGSFALGGGVSGIGLEGDLSPINYWDVGATDMGFNLAPTNSILSSTVGYVNSASNQIGVDPLFVSVYSTTIEVLPWRGNPTMVNAMMVAFDVPPTLMGNYHIQDLSPAIGRGASSKNGVLAPIFDIDGDARPLLNPTVGADQPGPRGAYQLVLPESIIYEMLYLPVIFQ